jgi:hypothetical protein
MSLNKLNGGLEWLQRDARGYIIEDKKTASSALSANLNSSDINEYFNPIPCNLSFDERLKLVNRVGEEVETPENLKELL